MFIHLLVVSKVVVVAIKFSYGIALTDFKYSHAVLINKPYAS